MVALGKPEVASSTPGGSDLPLTELARSRSLHTRYTCLSRYFQVIGCASARSTTFVLSHIYLFIIFAPLSLDQYLDYIENVGVKTFVLVS